MYKLTTQPTSGGMKVNQAYEGETIEEKMDRIVNNNEPISDGAPLIYTERKEGIRPSTNIRTDRFEIAIEASDKVSKSYKARREENANKRKEKDGGTEPIQGDALKKDTDKSIN